MNQQQLSREIADFEFWQQTENECDRGYVRSGNSVMRRALEELEKNMGKYTIVSVSGGKFHRPKNVDFERDSAWKPREMVCGRSLEPMNYFETAQDADKHTGGRLARYICKQCEAKCL